MPERFDDLPILDEIGASLRAAMDAAVAAEAKPRLRSRLRLPTFVHRPLPVVIAALLLAGLGTGTAAATLTVLRGSPIPSPKAVDLAPEMTARAKTEQVSTLRASLTGDPLPFALRTSTSETGLSCVTVGQMRGVDFGIAGTDGVYRAMPPTVVDGCGRVSAHEVAVMGARTFAAPDEADVRTVLYGIGGDQLRTVRATIRGKEQPVEVWHGAFLLAMRGYREDNQPTVQLTFADGTTKTQRLGGGEGNVIDPTGRGWFVLSGTNGPSDETATEECVWLDRLRDPRPRHHPTPQICGAANGQAASRPAKPWFFDIRHFSGDDRGQQGSLRPWSWNGAPSRTIAYGYADPKQVRSILVTAGATRMRTTPTVFGAFAVVLPGEIDARAVRIDLELRDGTTRAFDRPTNLVQAGATP